MSKKKKILIYAHYYVPDTVSTGQILRELAEGMLDKFDITVAYLVTWVQLKKYIRHRNIIKKKSMVLRY